MKSRRLRTFYFLVLLYLNRITGFDAISVLPIFYIYCCTYVLCFL